MEKQKITNLTPLTATDENILVIKRDKILNKSEKTLSGFLPKTQFIQYINIIKKHKEFKWRSEIEFDPRYKQIIPYLIFRYLDKYFLMQRKSTSSEGRLGNKYSLGIGGHIKQEDLQSDDIFQWAEREFSEEIDYNGNVTIKPLGIINDESDSVGQVHIGFVSLLIGDSDKIKVKSELKDGKLFTLSQCKNFYNSMESWSQLIFNYLQTLKDKMDKQ